MTRVRRALLCLVGACLISGCRDERAVPEPPPASAPPSTPTPEQAADARRALVAWLDCEECVDGELDAVLRLGPLAVPSLVATLQSGPSPAVRERSRRALQVRYAALRAYASTHPDVRFDSAEDTWVAAQLANEVARYRVRSAEALARLGGADARHALAAALATPLRPDVEVALRKALASVEPRP